MLKQSANCVHESGKLFIFLFLIIVALGISLFHWSQERSKALPDSATYSSNSPKNYLAIGDKAAVVGSLRIPVAETMEFDGLSRERILVLRKLEVLKQSDLIHGDYSPSTDIFGGIIDGRPWWGLAGRFYFGSGEKSIAGPSTHSHGILNPYLLVIADFWHKCELRWDLAKVTPERAITPDFPYLPRISSLVWRPSKSRAEVVYEFSEFVALRSPLLDPKTPFKNPRVDLIVYNARDFGLEYVHVAIDKSKNIKQEDGPYQAFRIPQYFHLGRSCGLPGGANNLSPRFPAVEDISLESYPVRIVVHLWRNKPVSVKETPDFLFIITIR